MRQHLQFPDGSIPPKTVNGVSPDAEGNIELSIGEGNVTSVNGNLPDDSGAVTIPDATTATSGLMAASDKTKLENTASKTDLEALSFGEWISFTPSGTVVITHNFNDADAPGVLQLRDDAGHPYTLDRRIQYSDNLISINYAGLELTGLHKVRFFRSTTAMIDRTMPTGAAALYENYTGGTWLDSTGGGHDLNAAGTITASNGGAVFDSSDDLFTPATAWDMTTGAYTISIVMQASKTNSVFLGISGDVQYGYYNSNFIAGANSITTNYVSLSTVPESTPVHWLIVRNGSTTEYYLNGTKLDSAGTDYYSNTPTDGLGHVDSRYPFNGTVYHLALYNTILNAEQLVQCWSYVSDKYNL